MSSALYDPVQVQPMRDELVRLGFQELLTPEAVDREFSVAQGTLLVVVNSVCGCSAGAARPGVRLALQHPNRPDRLTTVFAGMEVEAVEQARSYFTGYPPSSPQIALFKDGELRLMLERQDIQGRDAESIAADLRNAFDWHCSPAV